MTEESASECLRKIAEKRQKFLEGLDANKGDINLDIFGDFYPDKAHFIYELLQNAEDVGATEAEIVLSRQSCTFTHNGKRLFTCEDVNSITGIHNSTKTKSADQIGKFGIGFKSVFVYTLQPEVHSGGYSFRIVRLVMPEEIARDDTKPHHTRFVLPLGTPKTAPAVAFDEVRTGLNTLPLTALLFLKNLKVLRWRIEGESQVEVGSVAHSVHHHEMQKRSNGKVIERDHFLLFSRPVASFPALASHSIGVAFKLDYLPTSSPPFNPSKSIEQQLRLVQATPGQVAVYFPARSEKSGLLFHVHAPFVPTPDRAAIKESPVSAQLIKELGTLAASALHAVRDVGLLGREALAVLPNDKDDLDKGKWDPIRSAVLNEMRCDPLTPTNDKKHAPADLMFQSNAEIKALLTPDDLMVLAPDPAGKRLWAIGTPQKGQREDKLLESLGVEDWGVKNLLDVLSKRAHAKHGDVAVIQWLEGKPDKWFQDLYLLVKKEEQVAEEKLQNARIVPCTDGSLRVATECFFADSAAPNDPSIPFVAKDACEKKYVRDFLRQLGVKDPDEAALVEQLLKRKYTAEAREHVSHIDQGDLKRFVALLENNSQHAEMFNRFCVLLDADGNWVQPEQVFLDEPYRHTGLRKFFADGRGKSRRKALSPSFKDAGIELDRLAAFADSIGALAELKIERCSCRGNPESAKLIWGGPGLRRTYDEVDEDFTIHGLAEVLREPPDIELSNLLWRTLASQTSSHWTKARYRKNGSVPYTEATSQLAVLLRDAKWVPTRDGTFVAPCDATRESLPDGFAFDPGWTWLQAIGFGQRQVAEVETANEQLKVAQKLGFKDPETLEHAKLFASLPDEVRNDFLRQRGLLSTPELPSDPNPNPERRRAKLQDEATKAPRRRSEVRDRSVSIGIDDVKKAARTYLQDRYTNRHGTMTCQVCQGRSPLPFRLPDGKEYFEAVEFLGREVTSRHLRWNYIALCPTHAAMFQHANESKDDLERLFRDANADDEGRYFVPVKLAGQELTIFFNGHWGDLRTALDAPDDQSTAGEEE
ncbi:MAG: hypothetical protein DPW14_12215 [Planctomycetes bacterium]|nr:hypothetical protein [Planctomycetota bacterium]